MDMRTINDKIFNATQRQALQVITDKVINLDAHDVTIRYLTGKQPIDLTDPLRDTQVEMFIEKHNDSLQKAKNYLDIEPVTPQERTDIAVIDFDGLPQLDLAYERLKTMADDNQCQDEKQPPDVSCIKEPNQDTTWSYRFDI